jgi:hypothetical protein
MALRALQVQRATCSFYHALFFFSFFFSSNNITSKSQQRKKYERSECFFLILNKDIPEDICTKNVTPALVQFELVGVKIFFYSLHRIH